MLKLVNIKKDYKMKDQEDVHALKGLSVNFRKNEFVAILGPSGCGKTSLLNIIGGLDRYTSGDLFIKGKSTKTYGDREWDTYRNHSVGFVFQSYNLIHHRNILGNVELALTIAGISKKERKQRALEALEKVGLKGMEKKKPNQLSGGQMQRVAIARALVNNPEIVLADEPTGALDSTTSIQIMDLLKEVAKDRLVIMVTHNPDLASQYATRIVKLFDGELVDDSMPYTDDTDEIKQYNTSKNEVIIEETKGKKKRTSMSFFTATTLSFSNLLSKLKRTILVAIAGSIGIIGISAVLAVSFGVNNYVDDMQNDMLSEYPLSITETAIDYTSLMTGLSSWDAKDITDFDLTTSVGVDSMINYLMDKYKDFTSVKTNEINDDLIAYIEAMPETDVAAIYKDYGIDVTNNIFCNWKRNNVSQTRRISLAGLTQMYIAELKTVKGFSEYAMFVDLFTNFLKELPGDEEFIMSQYDYVTSDSRFPKSANEILLVVDDNQTLTDLCLAQMGFFTEEEFINISERAIEENNENPDEEKLEKLTYPTSFTYDELLGASFMYYPTQSLYTYQTYNRTSVDFSLTIPLSGTNTKLDFEMFYNAKTDCLEGSVTVSGYTVSCTFTRVGDKDPNIKDELKLVPGEWQSSLSGNEFSIKLEDDEDKSLSAKFAEMPTYIPFGNYESSLSSTKGYMYDAFDEGYENGEEVKIVGIIKKKADCQFGSLSRGVYYTSELTKKFMKDANESDIVNSTSASKPGIKKYILDESDKAFEAYITFTYTSYVNVNREDVIEDVQGIATALNTDLSASLSSMISITGSSNFETNKTYLRSLSGLATKYNKDENGNIVEEEPYYFDDLPEEIDIYPYDFTCKNHITSYLDKWNQEGDITINGKTLTLENRDELTYSDTIGLIISLIDNLILLITVALISFTSLSLVVSCFMIAVITYISTMERVKEIGVIRSLGGRKKDVSRLFIAECLIIGLASGLIGIGVTYLLQLLLNTIVANFGVYNIAALPLLIALLMVALSIGLNVLSGLIPSMKASHQDPVTALRSE